MHKYKTMVTDYEGMQGILDAHAAQGWRLFSLTPDTWRKMSGAGRGMEPPPFDDLDTEPTQEYSASYYLLVFVNDDLVDEEPRMASLQEPYPMSQGMEFEN